MEIKDESYPSAKTTPIQSELKPIGQLTLKDAFGALTLGGASVAAGAILTMFVALPTAGYTFGTHVAEAKAHESMAALQTGNVMKLTELEATKAELATSSNINRTLQEQLGQKETQITLLREAVGPRRNCDYMRQQIDSTKRDLLREQHPMLIDFDRPKSEQRDKETIDRLETRLSQYVTQFSACTREGE